MSLFSELNELMVRYRFKPNPKLSQNFLVDEKALDRIVTAASIQKTDIVLEVGCGAGFVTRKLLLESKKVIGIEKDAVLAKLLRQEMKGNFELLEGDALELKWPSFSKMVSLPPYGISSDLVYKLLECDFEDSFLVFQKEFAEKLVAEPGFLDFGAISVLTQYYCEPKELFFVPNTSFFPKPPGPSVLVHLKRKKRFGSASNEKYFSSFVKQLFRHKNKSVSNSLRLSLPFLKKELPVSWENCQEKIKPLSFCSEKVYATEVKQFVQLFNCLNS